MVVKKEQSRRHGFSLAEMVVVVLVIGIIAATVYLGGSTVVRSARVNRTVSDLHNFSVLVSSALMEHPEIRSVAATTNKDKLKDVLVQLNAELPPEYQMVLVDGAMSGNIKMTGALPSNTKHIVCRSARNDVWDIPYYVMLDFANRVSSGTSEFYVTIMSAGPNGYLNLDGAIDVDDVFTLLSFQDEVYETQTYNMDTDVPTTLSGSAATSYVTPANAPVIL